MHSMDLDDRWSGSFANVPRMCQGSDARQETAATTFRRIPSAVNVRDYILDWLHCAKVLRSEIEACSCRSSSAARVNAIASFGSPMADRLFAMSANAHERMRLLSIWPDKRSISA